MTDIPPLNALQWAEIHGWQEETKVVARRIKAWMQEKGYNHEEARTLGYWVVKRLMVLKGGPVAMIEDLPPLVAKAILNGKEVFC